MLKLKCTKFDSRRLSVRPPVSSMECLEKRPPFPFMLCCREGNRRSSIALASRHSIYDLPRTGSKAYDRKRSTPPTVLHGIWSPFYIYYTNIGALCCPESVKTQEQKQYKHTYIHTFISLSQVATPIKRQTIDRITTHRTIKTSKHYYKSSTSAEKNK